MRMPQRLRKALLAIGMTCALFAAPCTRAADADAVTLAIENAAVDDVSIALTDAIAEEGITAPSESHFGDMLARTAPELGHRADLYAEARIYTFCSAVVAAKLATESAHNIAHCPLSIAVYSLPADKGSVYLGYRRSVDSAGGRAADALLARIAARTAAQFQHAVSPATR
ncbi:DUF302 domain-containing protein [Parazoarcus communis]|uniref:DUF302 domain-containing protein n=2 Tax=Parazoarcus communis TaxID=41977 RepID=A0A2U8GPM7_9RHOO|nr:DUF302 domain-containing protein [Parazoarcus communis]